MNIDNLWDNFLEQIKPKISSLSYDTWFKNTKLVSLDNNVAKILVDSPLQKKSLQETWYQTISDVFSEITNTSFDFEFVFEEEVKTNTSIPVENIGVPLNTPEKSNLNSKYTFDSFIVGDSNKFAYMAAVSVAENPGKTYNPLEDRLRTRFNWGLSVNIYPPEYEMRVEILHKKIIGQNMSGTISDDVIAYIANNCDSDVRQLEGALTRVIAYATMFNTSEINLNLAIDALKDYLSKSSFVKNNIQKIQQVVAEYYNITVEDLKSKKRKADIAFPRQVAIYLCRTLTDESFPKIGIQFGGRDHSTVMHSVDKIDNELKTNPQFKDIIDALKSKIK